MAAETPAHWPHTVTFISLPFTLSSLSIPHSLFFILLFSDHWEEFLDRNFLSEWHSLIWLFFLSVVSLSALLTAQEGACCLLKLSSARNTFTVVMYKNTHAHTLGESCSFALTWHESVEWLCTVMIFWIIEERNIQTPVWTFPLVFFPSFCNSQQKTH